jgi:hypothetical protein
MLARIEMMAMTTSSSIKVNPPLDLFTTSPHGHNPM